MRLAKHLKALCCRAKANFTILARAWVASLCGQAAGVKLSVGGVGRLLIVAENSFQLSVLLPMAEMHPAR